MANRAPVEVTFLALIRLLTLESSELVTYGWGTEKLKLPSASALVVPPIPLILTSVVCSSEKCSFHVEIVLKAPESKAIQLKLAFCAGSALTDDAFDASLVGAFDKTSPSPGPRAYSNVA